MPYFDSHTHVHFAAFKDDSEAVIDRALKAGVWMVTVGTQKDTSKGAVETANKYSEGVYAAVGLHPIHTDRSFHDAAELGASDGQTFTSRGEVFDYGYYKELGEDPKTVAIGECGLDFFRFPPEVDKDAHIKKQKDAFDMQISLAHELRKPLMIHCRNAFPELISMLRERREMLLPEAGVIHFFTGQPEDAKSLLDLGFGFTFGGVATFARDYDESIRLIPKDKILSETDAPYVAPVPYRGKRNEPAYVVETAKKLGEIKGLVAGEMEEALFQNARRIFRV